MLLVLLLSIISAAAAVCPAGYQQINGGDCFKLYTGQQTYDNAETQCVQDGGHLASEQNALTAILGTTTPLIGLKCSDGTSANCKWADGSAMDYSNFPGGGPVIAYGSCVHLAYTDTNWYSWNCAAPIGAYLCRIRFNAPPAGACTGDYVAYNGGCAALKKVTRTKSDAEANCVAEGGHLASIHSEADNTFYTQLASNQGLNNNVFLGAAWNTGNGYKWTDGTAFDYNKWANQFPNTVFGECVQLMLSTEFGTLGQWTNIPCSTPLFYFCAKPSGGAPDTPKAPAQCQPIQFFYDDGTVYSPNFPLSIPAGQSCEYVLATAVGTKVSVNFPSFSTDAGTSLSLYDGLDDLTPKTKLSGTVNPQQSYESATNIMKMIFTASATTTGSGWQANFATIGGNIDPHTDSPVDPSGQCPQQQYYADTYVYSPNWPEPYGPMADCLYYIHSKDNRRMTIEFGYVDTEQCCDFVNVYDGPDNKSKLLGRVSGQNSAQVQQFYSTGNILTLEFFSDSNNEGNGWIASVYNM